MFFFIDHSGVNQFSSAFVDGGSFSETMQNRTDSIKSRLKAGPKLRVTTPDIVAKIIRLKTEDPSILARKIRERLLEEFPCTHDHLPSISSINRVLRNLSIPSVSTAPTSNYRHQTSDFYFHNLLRSSAPVVQPAVEVTSSAISQHFIHYPNQINWIQLEDTNEPHINNDLDYRLLSKEKIPRGRITLTKEQRKALEKEFEYTHYPDVHVRERLSKKIHLEENRIQVWFHNQRNKRHREGKMHSQKRTHIACESSTNDFDYYCPTENQQNLMTPSLHYSCSSAPNDCYECLLFSQRSLSYYPSHYNTLVSNTMHPSFIFHSTA